MNDPFKIREIENFLNSHKVEVCALFETRVMSHNSSKIIGKMGKDWSRFCNYRYSPICRIWIGWKHVNVQLSIEDVHEQYVICKASCGAYLFQSVVVYGLHTLADRRRLCNDLSRKV